MKKKDFFHSQKLSFPLRRHFNFFPTSFSSLEEKNQGNKKQCPRDKNYVHASTNVMTLSKQVSL